jgi:hypothetical protein
MNQAKIASWIEQAEARSVCELATAEPNLFKMASTPPLRSSAARTERAGFFARLRHLRPVQGMRRAA